MNKDLVDIPIIYSHLADLKQKIYKKNLIFKKEHTFIFVCGGSSKEDHYLRSKFLKYAASHLSGYQFILAEKCLDTQTHHQNFLFKNLAIFEDNLAHLSSCVLIFPESPGSFAEVGYFSKNEKISMKTLVVNLTKYQEDSFLILGPIDLINKKTFFTPTVNLNDKNPESDFKHIVTKLSRIKNSHVEQHSQRVAVKNLKDEEKYLQLMMILKIIDLFRTISIADLKSVFKKLFNFYDYNHLHNFLGILEQCQFIKVYDSKGHMIIESLNSNTGIKIQDFNEEEFKLQVSNSIIKHYSE